MGKPKELTCGHLYIKTANDNHHSYLRPPALPADNTYGDKEQQKQDEIGGILRGWGDQEPSRKNLRAGISTSKLPTTTSPGKRRDRKREWVARSRHAESTVTRGKATYSRSWSVNVVPFRSSCSQSNERQCHGCPLPSAVGVPTMSLILHPPACTITETQTLAQHSTQRRIPANISSPSQQAKRKGIISATRHKSLHCLFFLVPLLYGYK